MKIFRNVLIVIVVLFLLFGAFLVAYKMIYSQKIINDYEVNNPVLENKVLIASQGSSFKKQLVDNLTKSLENQAVYIKITDVTNLSAIDKDGWDAITIINTCEAGKLQSDVAEFLKNIKDTGKVILLTTSGSGQWQPENIVIDSISSASKKENVDRISNELYNKVNLIINDKKN